MKFSCKLTQHVDGSWTIRHVGAEVGTVEVDAATKGQAMEKMYDELRYRLEHCSCTGESYRHTQIEIVPQEEPEQ
jgi:hypothetical protein